MTLEYALRMYAEEHRRQWGLMAIESATAVAHEAPSTVHRWGAWYTTEAFTSEARTRLQSMSSAALVVSAAPNLVSFTTSVTNAVAVAREPWTQGVMLDDPKPIDRDSVDYPTYPGLPTADTLPSSSLTSNSDVGPNADGYFGKGVKVGLFETQSRNGTEMCRINETHEAFDFVTGAGFNYPLPDISCMVDSVCVTQCSALALTDPAAADFKCVNGQCIDGHLTAVASRIASAQRAESGRPGGPFHAAEVEFFVAPPLGLSTPSSGQWPTFYQALHDNGVRLVNESFGLGIGFNYRSTTSDWYSRNANMTIVQSSGNRENGRYSTGRHEVTCSALNNVCVGGTQRSYIDPRIPESHLFSALARWMNPYGSLGTGEGKEIEKPDVAAESYEAHTALADSDDKWWETNPTGTGNRLGTGTSFSAPVVTGLLALLEEVCGQGPLSAAYNRAVLRTFGTWTPSHVEQYSSQVLGWSPSSCLFNPAAPAPLYPAPNLGCDHYAGAGIVSARLLDRYACPGEQLIETCGTLERPCVSNGTGTLTNESFDETVPTWMNDTAEQDWFGNSTSSALRQSSGRVSYLYEIPASLEKEARVRATFSYYSCPTSTTQAPSTLAVANNLDLVLIGTNSAGQTSVLYSSETLDDANEGFDVRLSDDFARLTIALVGPDQLTPCPDVNGTPVVGEPYAWAIAWGGP